MDTAPTQPPPAPRDPAAADWERWKRLVRAAPEVRADKVAHSREAMRGGVYERSEVLEETLTRMIADLDLRWHD